VPGKINGFSNSPPAPAAAGVTGQRSAAVAGTASQGGTVGSGSAGGSGSATDSVRITDTASHLISAEQTLSDVPVINSSRVAELSDALANGTYKISAEKIANQLLQFERLMPEEQESAA
jgi:negative regulator of flagellin synthesis FlgM